MVITLSEQNFNIRSNKSHRLDNSRVGSRSETPVGHSHPLWGVAGLKNIGTGMEKYKEFAAAEDEYGGGRG